MIARLIKLKRLIRNTFVTARHLARLAGSCIAIAKAIIPGKMMLRGLYSLLATRHSWDSTLVLDSRTIQDLNWWLNHVSDWNGRPIRKETIDIQITTDASSMGWGAVLEHRQASGTWTTTMSHKPSNIREMTAILMALLTFRNIIQGKNVQIVTDNISSMANLNHFGGPTLQLTRISRAIWNLALKLKVNLSARHLSGSLNFEADRLSRTPDQYDWMLHPGLFRLIENMYGPHTIDRFATFNNAQITRYNSRFWDPFSEGVDALAQVNWSEENNYCNPPWRLIPQLLKVIKSQAAQATVIAPIWPAQPWYRQLKRMSIDRPVILRPHPRLFLREGKTPEPLKHKQWKVGIFRISGKID